jgi:hypothetical protein
MAWLNQLPGVEAGGRGVYKKIKRKYNFCSGQILAMLDVSTARRPHRVCKQIQFTKKMIDS